MKQIKIAVIACFAMMFSLNAFSQVFEPGDNFIAVGYGYPNWGKGLLDALNTESTMKVTGYGPLHLKIEHAVSENFGIGLSLNLTKLGTEWSSQDSTWNATSQQYDVTTYNYKASVMRYSAIVRFNGHWPIDDHFDFYAGAGVGYRNNKWTTETNEIGYEFNNTGALFPVGFEATLGLRYFMNPHIGLYVETGIAKSLIQGGLVGRF